MRAARRARAEPQLRRCRRSRSRSAPDVPQRRTGRPSPDVRRDDVGPAQTGLVDEPGQEPAHRARRQEIVAAFGCAEPRQVDGEQAGVLGKRGPDRRERVHALRPGAGEQHRRLLRAAAVGVADPDSVNGTKSGLWDRRDPACVGPHGLLLSWSSGHIWTRGGSCDGHGLAPVHPPVCSPATSVRCSVLVSAAPAEAIEDVNARVGRKPAQRPRRPGGEPGDRGGQGHRRRADGVGGAVRRDAAHGRRHGQRGAAVDRGAPQRAAGRRPHRSGYGPERYYWALLAAAGMFVVGGAVSIYQGSAR